VWSKRKPLSTYQIVFKTWNLWGQKHFKVLVSMKYSMCDLICDVFSYGYTAIWVKIGLYIAFTGCVFLTASGPKSSSCMVYKVLHGCAMSYLGPFTYVADLPSRLELCSSCSDCLVQPPVHRSTVGSRAFSVAGPQVWNCLPPEVTSAPSVATFRTRLKTFHFTESYPDIRLIWHFAYTHCL